MTIGWGCITSTIFTMTAKRLVSGVTNVDTGVTTSGGHWEERQDSITGEIDRVWVPEEDDPSTEENENTRTFICEARAVITGGLNTQGTAERWTSKGEYENVDYITIKFPPDVLLTDRDQVTEVRGPDGKILWLEEAMGQVDDETGNPIYRPTIFDVGGVSPVLDPFGGHVQNYAMLTRSERQATE